MTDALPGIDYLTKLGRLNSTLPTLPIPCRSRQLGKVFVNFAVYALATLFIEEAAMAKLTRWGNSVGGLRLPEAIIEAAVLRVGDEVSCRLLDSGAILLTPCRGTTQIAGAGTSVASVPCPEK